MIKTECIIEIEKIKNISITCPRCESELRLSLKYDFSGICPSCANKIPATNYINEIRRCIEEIQQMELSKNKQLKISLINEENRI